VRLGVRVAETAWVESGGGASPEGGVMVDMGMGRHDELRGPSPEANGWATVEAALNWVVSASCHGNLYYIWIFLMKTS